MKNKYTELYACTFLIIYCALSVPAHATLGRNASTIDTDFFAMRAIKHDIEIRQRYTTHLLTLPSGTVVREYVASNGIVFGVAWDGPTLPNLKITLGVAFEAYLAAAAKHHANQLVISNGELVAFSSGHLRAFEGHAYLPQSIPVGVVADVVR